MRRERREVCWASFMLLVCAMAASAAAADDGIRLTVSKGAAAGDVKLDWNGARPAFEVYRSPSPAGVTSSFDRRIGLTRDATWTDTPPEGDVFYYLVGPRWPQFYSSDPAHDDLLNDLLARHARAEYTDDSLRRSDSAVPGMWTTTLWRDWEIDELLWHDYSTTNYPLDQRSWFVAYYTAITPVDKFGYYYSGGAGPEAPTAAPNCCFRQGWPFPTYADSQGHSVGWEWNGLSEEGWTLSNAQSDGVSGGEWRASTTKRDPQIVSPAFSVDAFQAPFVDLEIQYDAIDPLATPAERVWRLYWETADDPKWTLSKSVTSDTFPLEPVAAFTAGTTLATFHLPMHLHALWTGHTITRVRLDPIEPTAARSASWRLNFLRLDYDTRMSVNNPIFVRFVGRKFFWDGDASYLAGQLTRMRRATQFMLTHMRGDALGFLDHSWFVGHDGLGWIAPGRPRVGHGLQNNWFDIVTTGPRDLLAAVRFYRALVAMAEVEAFVEAHPEYDAPKPTIVGPDGSSTVPYIETSASLESRLGPARAAIHAEFWNPETGRYAGWRRSDGVLVDYGLVQANLEALDAGIPDAASAASILSWLDGTRTVAGDTSTGADLYLNRFAVRANAKKNDLDWIWGWAGSTVPFANQVEDGGSSLHTTAFDVGGRLAYGDVAGAWRTWQRMLSHHATVRAFGGTGASFYRDYYAAHPELGSLQGCGTPGGLGLDCEFVESMLTPAAWVTAWLGMTAPRPGVLRIAPSRPADLGEMGARSIVYRGHRLDVRHARDVIDLTGSTLGAGASETLELFFRGAYDPRSIVTRDGAPAPGDLSWSADGLTLRTPIAASKYEVRSP